MATQTIYKTDELLGKMDSYWLKQSNKYLRHQKFGIGSAIKLEDHYEVLELEKIVCNPCIDSGKANEKLIQKTINYL